MTRMSSFRRNKGVEKTPPPECADVLARWELFKKDKGSVTNELSTPRSLEQQVGTIKGLLADGELHFLTNKHIRYAVRSRFAGGNQDRALEFISLIDDSVQGIVRSYVPETKLLGAENRSGISCYLDTVLFAMFARLDFFEALLYKDFPNPPERNLVVLLRLWVNTLRAGKLIPTDLTAQLQDTIAACGWKEAGLLRQQDVSEAFTFIMDTLKSPLLTLKMDLIHDGEQDAAFDHKIVNERLLEVAIPSREDEDDRPITLEDCLEEHFNSRVEVRRYLESQSSADLANIGTKGFHNQPTERAVNDSPNTSAVTSPTEGMINIPVVTVSNDSLPELHRTSSIVQRRFVSDSEIAVDRETNDSETMLQKGSIRKEVMMPAWQVFSLLPWYANNQQKLDPQTQSATHFSSQRPILGISLKRYSVTPTGKTLRLGTYVDIPLEIGFPHFINDNQAKEGGPLYGRFKLALQAIICHRGDSVNSGHYVSLVRTTNDAPSEHESGSAEDSSTASSPPRKYWMRFDNLAKKRITLTDIEEALKTESPYLLFYQILPIDADPAELGPPTEGELSDIRIPLTGRMAERISDSSSADSHGPTVRPFSGESLQVPTEDPVPAEHTTTVSNPIPIPQRQQPAEPIADPISTSKQSKNRQSSAAESRIGSLFSRRKSAEPLRTENGWRLSVDHRRAKSAERQRSKERARELKQHEIAVKKAKRDPQRECRVM